MRSLLACAILLIASGVCPALTNAPVSTTQSAEDQKLDDTTRAKLGRPCTAFMMDSVDFEGCLGYLEKVGGVRIVVPWDEVEAAKISRDKPLIFDFRQGTLKNALNTTLGAAAGRPGVLSYVIKRGDIVVVVNVRGTNQSEMARLSSNGNVPDTSDKKHGSSLVEVLKARWGTILAIAIALLVAVGFYYVKRKWGTAPLRRRLYCIAAALSLILCLASIILWVQSYQYAQWLSWTPTPTPTEKRSFTLHVRYGGISLEGYQFTRTQVEPDWDESGKREIWNQSGFDWRKGHAFAGNAARFRWKWTVRASPISTSRSLIAEAPIWAVSLCLFVLMLLLAWRGWPRGRNPNACATCAYDLTANTSGVCPECGTLILTSSGVTR